MSDDLIEWFLQDMEAAAEQLRTVSRLFCGHSELTDEDGEGYALCTRCKGAQPQRLTPEILKRSLGDD